MSTKDFLRRTSVRRRTLVVTMALMALMAGLGSASSALAVQPTGDFVTFNQCPRFEPGVSDCTYSEATGETILNKLTVPLTNPITIQFGFKGVNPNVEIVGALNKETITPTPEPVPGGLSSVIDCSEIKGRRFPIVVWRAICKRVFEHTRYKSVNLITELAGPASTMYVNTEKELFEEGVSLTYPVKFRLENPLLGKHCYIGSNAEPVKIESTTGTTNPPAPNKPISGKEGEISFKDNFTYIRAENHTSVDNSFAVPAAKGCGGDLSFLIDPLINGKVGLPSAAGHNTLVHNGFGSDANAKAVIASEK